MAGILFSSLADLLPSENHLSLQTFPFKRAVIYFTIAVAVFESYLELRQLLHLRKRTIPEALQGVVQESKFSSTRAYCLHKWNYSMVSRLWNVAEMVLVLHYDVLAMLWTWVLKPMAWCGLGAEHELARSIVFTLVYMCSSTLLGLPFSIYETFYLEQKHGFNKQTPWLFFKDSIKTLVLSLVLVPTLEAVVIPIIQYGGDLLALWLWLAMLTLSIVMMTVYPVLIAPLFNKFQQLPEGELRGAIEELAASLNFPLQKLFVVDGSTRSAHSNAYMYGFFRNKRIVLYDTLVSQCEGHDEEIVAVLAHELGHWKLKHTVFNFAAMQLIVILQFTLFAVVRHTTALYVDFGFDSKPALISLLLFQHIISPVDHVVSLAFNLLSRHFEFQADAFACKLHHGPALRNGLIRLQEENKSSPNLDPWYSAYHHTHPPLGERLKAIADCKEE